MSTVNSVHERIGELQRQSYDPSNTAHVALFESLWESLMPETRRTDWTPLGFQNGSKPESDLRGMGMLGEMIDVWFMSIIYVFPSKELRRLNYLRR